MGNLCEYCNGEERPPQVVTVEKCGNCGAELPPSKLDQKLQAASKTKNRLEAEALKKWQHIKNLIFIQDHLKPSKPKGIFRKRCPNLCGQRLKVEKVPYVHITPGGKISFISSRWKYKHYTCPNCDYEWATERHESDYC